MFCNVNSYLNTFKIQVMGTEVKHMVIFNGCGVRPVDLYPRTEVAISLVGVRSSRPHHIPEGNYCPG